MGYMCAWVRQLKVNLVWPYQIATVISNFVQ